MQQNLGQAKALIDEAGASGATREMNYLDARPEAERAALVLQDALGKIGGNVDLRPLPCSTMFQVAGDQPTAMDMSILLKSTFTLNQNYGCAFSGKPYNWSGVRAINHEATP